MKFDLPSLVPRSKFGRRKSIVLKPVKLPLSFELQYRRQIRKLTREIATEVSQTVRPRYIEWSKFRDSASWFEEIRLIVASLDARITNTVATLFRAVADRHTKRWFDEVYKRTAVDISAIATEEELQPILADAVSKNVSLIKSLETGLLTDVERMVMDAKALGKSWRELSPEIVNRFGVAQSRGDLIARDQMGSINAVFNQTRQEQAGIEKYEWHTSQDERVRKRHIPLDGKTYEWGERTGAEEGLPPGMPIQCRCTAAAVIELDGGEASIATVSEPISTKEKEFIQQKIETIPEVKSPPDPEKNADGTNKYVSVNLRTVTNAQSKEHPTGVQFLPDGKAIVTKGNWEWNLRPDDRIASELLKLGQVPGEYWRGTNNKNELAILGKLNSRNWSEGFSEGGVSVSEGFGGSAFHGFKYYYKLTGDVIGTGSDGEPVLKNAKAITGLLSEKKGREMDSIVFEEALKKIKWSKEDAVNALNHKWKLFEKFTP